MSGSESFETSIAPWLAVSDAQEAVDFYRSAFGAVEVVASRTTGGSWSPNSRSQERPSWSSRTHTRVPTRRASERFG